MQNIEVKQMTEYDVIVVGGGVAGVVHAVSAMIVVMVGYIGPLRHYRGRYGQPGGVIVLVPLTDAFDRNHKKHTENHYDHQRLLGTWRYAFRLCAVYVGAEQNKVAL